MGILKSIFGPSKAEIWKQVAEDIDGDFEEGGFWKKDFLRFQSGEWEITLDQYQKSGANNYDTTYTRMRAPFVNKDNLQFEIYKEGFFSSIGKFFGTQDIIVKDVFFDEEFMIKGNNEDKIIQLLSDDKLKRLISYQDDIYFSIEDDSKGFFEKRFPNGVDALYFECNYEVKNVKDLKKLFELFTYTLERLVAIDSAYDTDSGIKLS